MQALQVLTTLLKALQGSRTYLTAGAAVLASLAGLFGLMPCDKAQSIAVAFGALAAISLRLSNATTLSEVLKALEGPFKVELPPDENEPNDPQDLGTIRFPGIQALLLALILSAAAVAQDQPQSMRLSPATRSWFHNPDGSCVQCSIGMCGVHCNNLNAASLLWDTDYGPAVRGGSWPSRVEQYCDQRGIKAWSVTGSTVDDTMPWIQWAARTGRFAAIGAGRAHFQTLYGYEPADPKPWLVCNNQSPARIDRYTDPDFRRLHAASGPWVVILQQPSSDPPALTSWWRAVPRKSQ